MKIKLTINDRPDKAYVTIDPMPQEGPAFTGNIVTLKGVCEQAELQELLADTMLDYIPYPSIEDAVKGWCKLLRHGGRIILGGTNINEVARLVVTKQLEPGQYNQALYGEKVRKTGLYSVEQIEKLLKANGVDITRKSISGLRFVIEGVRP